MVVSQCALASGAQEKSQAGAQEVQISVDTGLQRAAISWVIRSAYTTSGVGLSNTGPDFATFATRENRSTEEFFQWQPRKRQKRRNTNCVSATALHASSPPAS